MLKILIVRCLMDGGEIVEWLEQAIGDKSKVTEGPMSIGPLRFLL